MTLQLARWVYLLLAVAVVLASHVIVRTVVAYRDGRSQAALLTWFRALRVYGLFLALNMVANIVLNGSAIWGLWLSVLGAVYMVYALVRFLCTVRGWR